jgi:hypothetical protein
MDDDKRQRVSEEELAELCKGWSTTDHTVKEYTEKIARLQACALDLRDARTDLAAANERAETAERQLGAITESSGRAEISRES